MKPYMIFLSLLFCLVVIFIWLFSAILAPFVVGLFASYAMRPLYLVMKHANLGENFSAFICTFLLFVCLLLVVLLGLPILAGEIANFVSSLPIIFTTIEEWLSHVEQYFEMVSSRLEVNVLSSVQDSLVSNLRTLLSSVLNIAGGVSEFLSFLGLLFLSPLVSFYFLRDWGKIVTSIQSQFPRRMSPGVKELMEGIDSRMSGFFRGQLSVCVFLGFYYGIGLELLGINFGLLLGLLTGFLALLPYVGLMIGFMLTVLIALMQYYVEGVNLWWPIVLILVLFGSGQILESAWLSPKLVGGELGLHPLWFIFAVLGGGTLAGFFGILLAIPATIVLVESVRKFLQHYHESSFYRGAD